jgi:transposase-like protein
MPGKILSMSANDRFSGGGGADTQRFSPRQKLAIALLAEGEHAADVGRLLGVTARTIRRWRQMPGFEAAIGAAVHDRLGEARRLLVQGTTRAARELGRLCESATSEAVRVSACKAVLELAHDMVAFEGLEARIAAIEAAEGGNHA